MVVKSRTVLLVMCFEPKIRFFLFIVSQSMVIRTTTRGKFKFFDFLSHKFSRFFFGRESAMAGSDSDETCLSEPMGSPSLLHAPKGTMDKFFSQRASQPVSDVVIQVPLQLAPSQIETQLSQAAVLHRPLHSKQQLPLSQFPTAKSVLPAASNFPSKTWGHTVKQNTPYQVMFPSSQPFANEPASVPRLTPPPPPAPTAAIAVPAPIGPPVRREKKKRAANLNLLELINSSELGQGPAGKE